MEVQVLELDAANRRLALSHKHMEEKSLGYFRNDLYNRIGSQVYCDQQE
jgi:ribosomal protein S1